VDLANPKDALIAEDRSIRQLWAKHNKGWKTTNQNLEIRKKHNIQLKLINYTD
jgi:hypothetical protein